MVAAKDNANRAPVSRQNVWLGVGKFLMLLCMAVLFFLLAQEMVRNHFFTGGALNYRMGGGW